MIYRGPGFLAVVLFSSSPTPFPFLRLSVCRRPSLQTGEGGGGGGGAKSYDREKAWPSKNHSILSARTMPRTISVNNSFEQEYHVFTEVVV
jgi:hypothetical protein